LAFAIDAVALFNSLQGKIQHNVVVEVERIGLVLEPFRRFLNSMVIELENMLLPSILDSFSFKGKLMQVKQYIERGVEHCKEIAPDGWVAVEEYEPYTSIVPWDYYGRKHFEPLLYDSL
jgi:hypothetical protein